MADAIRSATRYLFHRRPAGRITCVIQGRNPPPSRGPDDRIVPSLPPEEVHLRPETPIWGLSVVLAGSVTIRDADGEHRLEAGGWFQFLGVPSSARRLDDRSADFREAAISVDAATGAALAEAGLWRRELSQAAAPPDPAMAAACEDLQRALLDLRIGSAGLLRRLALVLELAYAGAAAAGDGFAARACRVLAEHPEPAFAVSDAARQLGIGIEAFRKRFRAEVGMAPGAWHQRHRIEQATALLATASVTEVARRLGYPDAFAFSRQFRRVTGVPPSRVRR
jgi:AraC-like DNA-binding protein